MANGALIWCVLICCLSQCSSLMSKYQKAHPRAKWRIMVIILYFCELSLTSYGWWKRRKKDKREIFVVELLDCTKGYRRTSRIASQYTSEANFSESLGLDCFTFRTRTPYTLCIVRHFKRSITIIIWSCYRTLWYYSYNLLYTGVWSHYGSHFQFITAW